jgi:hypothetical protein
VRARRGRRRDGQYEPGGLHGQRVVRGEVRVKVKGQGQVRGAAMLCDAQVRRRERLERRCRGHWGRLQTTAPDGRYQKND